MGLECLLPGRKLEKGGDFDESPLVGREEFDRLREGSERRLRLKLRKRRRGLREREMESERTDLESSPEELASTSASSSQAGVNGRVWLRLCCQLVLV